MSRFVSGTNNEGLVYTINILIYLVVYILCSLTEMYLTLFTFTEISDAMTIINKTDLFSWHYDSQLKR